MVRASTESAIAPCPALTQGPCVLIRMRRQGLVAGDRHAELRARNCGGNKVIIIVSQPKLKICSCPDAPLLVCVSMDAVFLPLIIWHQQTAH